MNHIPGWIRCLFVGARISRGRARTRCPRCGATLQSTDPKGHHYIEPKSETK